MSRGPFRPADAAALPPPRRRRFGAPRRQKTGGADRQRRVVAVFDDQEHLRGITPGSDITNADRRRTE